MTSIIISSGVVSSGLVANSETPIYVSGGTITETTVDSYGHVTVMLDGGIADSTIINASGGLYVSSGGQCRNTVLDGNGAYLHADYNVAYVTGTTVNSGGIADLQATWIDDLVVNSWGRVNVFGGTVHNAVVNGQGSMTLTNSRTIAYDMLISGSVYERAYVSAANGATIEGATVGPAWLIVSGGTTTLNNAQIENGGMVSVGRGAVASNATVNFGGSMSISGGSADLVTVNSGGWLSAGYEWGYYSSGGATRVVENGGAVYIGSNTTFTSSWDSASSRYVSISSTYIFPVEFASNTFSGLVFPATDGRWATVHSGTTALDIKTSGGGGMTVFSGGIVSGFQNTPATWTSTWSGWEYSSHYDEESGEWIYESSLVSSSADVTTLGGLTVNSGGRVTGLVAQSLEGLDNYYNTYMSFQVARDTYVSGTVDGADFNLSNGQLSDVNVKDVSFQYMSGSFAHDVTQVNGSAFFDSRSYAANMVYSGTNVTVSRGAAVDGVKTVAVPYTYTEYPMSFGEEEPEPIVVETSRGGSVRILAGATVTNLDLDEATSLDMQVSPFTTVTGMSGGVAVNQQGGVFASASLGSTTIEVLGSSAYYDEATSSIVSISGGTAADLIVNMGAGVIVSSGGLALNMTENGGAVSVDWDYYNDKPLGTATFASNTFSYDHLEGAVTVHKNTIAQDNVFYGGDLAVYSGGIVNNFYTVPGMPGAGGGMVNAEFESGAIISNFDTVRYASGQYHPGHFGYAAGIRAEKLRITDYDGITLGVDKDTVIANASLDNIPFAVTSGVLSGFHAAGNGWFSNEITITDGGRMIDCYIDSFGQVTLMDGASADNLTVANNYLSVSSGCVAENVTVGLPMTVEPYEKYNSAGAYVNGTIRDFTVNDHSTVEVYSGGKATGAIRLGSDGTTQLKVYYDGVLEFDLTDKSALSAARVDNLNAVSMDYGARYDIVVGAEQAAGKYVLADNYQSDVETKYNLVGISGTTYGCFIGDGHSKYVYYKESSTQPDYNVSLDRVTINGEDDTFTEQLVLTVDSSFSPLAWLATPTITASSITFTNQDVVLTATAEKADVEFSLDGTTWQAYTEGGLSVSDNGTYYFRAVDRTIVSDVATYTVSNIDKAGPTLATDLSATVGDESNVTLRWTDATDEFSGVKGYTLTYWQDGMDAIILSTPAYINELSGLANGTWHWTVQTYDYAGNVSDAVAGTDFAISGGTVTPTYIAKGDVDGNGISDVLFQYTGGQGQLGYWMNGTNTWRSTNATHPTDTWQVLGTYDMDANGKADSVLVGNVEVGGVKGSFIGYYTDAIDEIDGSTWVNISYLGSDGTITWQNKVGNLTGAAGMNSIVWYSPEAGALGAWTDGTDNWVSLGGGYTAEGGWDLVGCGDFSGSGKDSVIMSYAGQAFYTVGIDGVGTALTTTDAGWEIRAIGDFAGDGKDDIVAFHTATGLVAMWGDGDAQGKWSLLGQLDAGDWFVVGAGDYNGDQQDDLLVRQYSTGMLGYYSTGDMAQWNTLGYGVGMDWTVIA